MDLTVVEGKSVAQKTLCITGLFLDSLFPVQDIAKTRAGQEISYSADLSHTFWKKTTPRSR